MIFSIITIALAAASALAQNCGSQYGNQVCATGSCCSQYGWCANDAAHCDATSCQPLYSGSGSSCAKQVDSAPYGNCGPNYNYTVCSTGQCCSSAGWCDTDAAHCDPSSCPSKYSGSGSSCAKLSGSGSSTLKTTTTTSKTTTSKTTTTTKPTTTMKTTTTTTKTSTSSFSGPYASQVPEIDVCGAASNNVSCPGAGINGYFYRCCSSHGHCGPKNNIQDQAIYCGVQEAGCQSQYGSCQSTVPLPPNPTGTPGISANGSTCGPIVNMKCAPGLCCSGSNFCGSGPDFCGSANWCQSSWGICSGQ